MSLDSARLLPPAFTLLSKLLGSLKSDNAAAKDSQKQPYQDVYELNWAMRYLRLNA